MLNKLAHKILKSVAQILIKYANSIEKYLTKENLPDKHVVSEVSNDLPPVHWLEKVRQGAPHLLNETSREFKPGSNPYQVNDQDTRLNSDNQHKQETLVNSPAVPTQKPRFNKNPFRQPYVHHHSKNLLETVKKYFYKSIPDTVQTSTNTENNSEITNQRLVKRKKRVLFKKNSDNSLSQHIFPSVTEPPLNDFNQKKPLNPSQKMDEVASINKKFKSKNASNASPKPTARNTAQKEKNHQQPETLSGQIRPKNQTRIHLYPNSQRQTKADKEIQHDYVKNQEIEWNHHLFSSKKQKIKTPEIQQQKIIVANRNGPNKANLSSNPRKNVHKQQIVHNIQTIKTTSAQSLDFSAETVSHQHKKIISVKTNKLQLSSMRWPCMLDETLSDTNQDRWPQLPKEEWIKTKETVNQPFKHWQQQEDTRRKTLSEHEQRGILWNA